MTGSSFMELRGAVLITMGGVNGHSEEGHTFAVSQMVKAVEMRPVYRMTAGTAQGSPCGAAPGSM